VSDPLSALVSPVWSGLAALRGPGPARSAVATLLNAAALDAWCGHTAHGDRAVSAIAGIDSPPPLRRQLASIVRGRRALWPDDRRVLDAEALGGDDRELRVGPDCADLDGPRAGWWGVRLLVEAPPVSRTELATRLAGLPRGPVRAALRHTLETSPMPDPVVDLITAAFEVVEGPGRQAAALARLAADDSQPSQRREVAWRVLMDHDDVDLEKVIDEVGASRIGELTRLGFAVGVRRISGSSHLATDLVEQIAPLDVPKRRELLEMIEESRTSEGIPATALYRALLLSRVAPELDAVLVRALEQDGGPLAEDTVRCTLAMEVSPARQARLRRALLTLRTRRIEPPVDRGEGSRAWVGLCDGDGDFPLVLATPNAREQFRALSLSVRAGGDVRDGFVLDDLPAARLEAMLDQYGASAELFEIAPAHAAAWVAAAVERAPGGLLGLPGALQRSSDEVLRHAHHTIDHEPRLDDDGARLTLSACRALFRRPRLQEWGLDDKDLVACGISPPPRDADARVRWAREGARLARRDRRLRGRFLARVRHLGEVLQATGDPEAALAFRIARALAVGRGESFLRVVLEHTGPPGPLPDLDGPLRFGDEGQREDIRRVLAPEAPVFRDLAALDVIDCILSSEGELVRTDAALADLRPDGRRAALTAAGRGLVDVLRRPALGLGPVEGPLVAAGLCREAADRVARHLRGLGARFRSEVCADCPIGCWSEPGAPAGRIWTGPGHPAVVARPA